MLTHATVPVRAHVTRSISEGTMSARAKTDSGSTTKSTSGIPTESIGIGPTVQHTQRWSAQLRMLTCSVHTCISDLNRMGPEAHRKKGPQVHQ